MTSTQAHVKSYEAGYAAALSLPRTANPYREGTYERRQWFAGWDYHSRCLNA